MSSKWVAAAACAIAAAGLAPAVAAAEPTVDAAVAEFQALGLTQLSQLPSGRVVPPTATSATNFGYRTYDQMNAELAALAAANPGFVTIKTAPYKSIEGRDVKYLEITNNVDAADGKPVFFHMGLIHGNEWAGDGAHAGVRLRRHQHGQDEPEGQGAVRQASA